MIRLVVFDLDGTLCPPGKAILPQDVEKLKKIEKTGVKIAFSSGKPTFYLCGLARQLDLKEPILIGENGGVIQFGVELPPKTAYQRQIPPLCRRMLKVLREKIEAEFGERMWFQPNETTLTPFFQDPADVPALRALIDGFVKPEMEIKVYEHGDCFDLQWGEVSKATGLADLSRLCGIAPSEMLSCGDWENDYPMFAFTGHSVGVHVPELARVEKNFATTGEALRFILSLLEAQTGAKGQSLSGKHDL